MEMNRESGRRIRLLEHAAGWQSTVPGFSTAAWLFSKSHWRELPLRKARPMFP